MQNFQMKDFDCYQRTPRLFTYSRIAIVGCGGSGSWIAESLVIAGCQHIILVDDDTLEDHNLNRTPYRMKDIGQKKAIALTAKLLELRNDVCIVPVVKKITGRDDFEKYLMNAHLIIDATDSFDFKMKFSEVGWDVPYLKVGYDGNMYDIDGSNEYIFDVASNQGYTIKSTTVMTTMMLASKVTQIAYAILTEGFRSTRIRVLGDIKEELGVTLSETGDIAIMTNNRGAVVDRIISAETLNDDDDFEFEIVEVERERYKEPEKKALTEDEIQVRYERIERMLDVSAEWMRGEDRGTKVRMAIEKRDANLMMPVIREVGGEEQLAGITQIILQ